MVNSREMTLSLPKQKMETVFESFEEPKNNRIANDKTFWSFDFNNSDDTFLQPAVLVSAAETNEGIAVEKCLPRNTDIRSTCSRRTAEMINNICLSAGQSLIQQLPQMAIQADAFKSVWDAFAKRPKKGDVWKNQYSGNESNLLFILTFTHKKLEQLPTDRQYTRPDISFEDGESTEIKNDKIF